MFIKEEKIATYTTKNQRIQLLKITFEAGVQFRTVIENDGLIDYYTKYQIRINRKVIDTYKYESQASRKMASIITSELLQQKFNF